MKEHGQDEKIEKLDLDDMDLDVEIHPTEVRIENLDFETDANVSDANTGVENTRFDSAVEKLTDNQLSNEEPENSYNGEGLSEPEAEENNNGQSVGENSSDEKSKGTAPTNDQTTPENSNENKENEKSQNDNLKDKKDNNNSNNNSENKKNVNKDSVERNNHDNGKNKPDLDNKKNQDTNRTPQDNKKKSENSSPSKPNNNKSEIGSKEKKPNGLNKKRNDLKNKWNNRPKTPKDFANRAKNGIKNGVKNRYNNSTIGKTINGGKKAIENGKKVAQKTKVAAKTVGTFLKTPAGLATLGVIAGLLLILVIVVMVPSMLASGSPQVGGEVQDEENYSKYSEVDQKTIDKLKKISEKYTSGNPSYAMAATLYPYIDEMQNGNVSSIRGKTNISQSDDEDVYDEEDNSDESDNEDLEESENDTISNDPYLELFRKRKYRKKFEKLLKISKDGDDALTKYLKKTWFKKDAGYKELFDDVKDEDALANAIIDDIQDQKDDFKGYFYDNCSTTYSSQSAGQITVDYSNSDGISLQELLTKNIMVDVKKSSCTETAKFKNCESMYSNPISMKQYVIGVTIQEVSDDLNNIEHIKANMIAEKSFAIGRAFQRENVSKIDDSTYVIGIIDSTRDQDYCDYLTGDSCSDGVKNSYKNYSSNLEQAWSESQNMYLSSEKKLIGSVCQNKSYATACSCKTGKCLFQDEVRDGYKTEKVDAILGDQFKNAKAEVITSDGGYLSSTIVMTNTTCSTTNDSSNFIYYAQNDYANTAFCGRTLSAGAKGCAKGDSICTSGCGVTSAAMAVATLTQNKNITPETINSSARVGTDCGSDGTMGSLFPYVSSNNGLEAKSISTKEDIISTLDSGGLVIANVNGVFGDGIYKTDGGHYVVVRGYSGDNVYIADPWQNQSMIKHCEEFNSSNHCTKLSTDFDTFVSNVKNHGAAGFYAITGGISFSESGSSGASQGTGKTTGYLTSPFGKNETNSQAKNHLNGNSSTLYYNSGGYHGAIDFAVASGTNVYAMDGGEVVTAHNDTGNAYGKYIIIKLSTSEKTYYNLYAHLSSIKVKEGEKVSQGQLIAKSGNTGTNTTGAHLHAELINSINCLGHTCRGTHYNVLKYIGTKKTYVGQKCDGKGC